MIDYISTTNKKKGDDLNRQLPPGRGKRKEPIMGPQKSQIYIRFNYKDRKGLIANDYNWYYGERMISRARWGIELINENFKTYINKYDREKLSRIFDVDFDRKEIEVGLDMLDVGFDRKNIEWGSFDIAEISKNTEKFFLKKIKKCKNHDGKLFIDIDNGMFTFTIKYAFLDRVANSDNIMDGEAYMAWDRVKEWRTLSIPSKEVLACEENIKFISKNAKLMTKEEVEEFINYKYALDD